MESNQMNSRRKKRFKFKNFSSQKQFKVKNLSSQKQKIQQVQFLQNLKSNRYVTSYNFCRKSVKP